MVSFSLANIWIECNRSVSFLYSSTRMVSKSTVSNDNKRTSHKNDCDWFVESRAICRYLEEKYKGKGTELIPTKDIKANFLFEQAANIEAFNFNPAASVMVYEKIFKK